MFLVSLGHNTMSFGLIYIYIYIYLFIYLFEDIPKGRRFGIYTGFKKTRDT